MINKKKTIIFMLFIFSFFNFLISEDSNSVNSNPVNFSLEEYYLKNPKIFVVDKPGFIESMRHLSNPEAKKDIGFFSKLGNVFENSLKYPQKNLNRLNKGVLARLLIVSSGLFSIGKMGQSLYSTFQLKKSFIDKDLMLAFIRRGHSPNQIPFKNLTSQSSLIQGSFQALFALWGLKDLFIGPKEDPYMEEVLKDFANEDELENLTEILKEFYKKEGKDKEPKPLTLSEFEKDILNNVDNFKQEEGVRRRFKIAIIRYRKSIGISFNKMINQEILQDYTEGLEKYLKAVSKVPTEIVDIENYVVLPENKFSEKIKSKIREIHYYDSFLIKLKGSIAEVELNVPVAPLTLENQRAMNISIQKFRSLIDVLYNAEKDLSNKDLSNKNKIVDYNLKLNELQKNTGTLKDLIIDKSLLEQIKIKDLGFYEKLKLISKKPLIRETLLDFSSSITEDDLKFKDTQEKIEHSLIVMRNYYDNYALVSWGLNIVAGKTLLMLLRKNKSWVGEGARFARKHGGSDLVGSVLMGVGIKGSSFLYGIIKNTFFKKKGSKSFKQKRTDNNPQPPFNPPPPPPFNFPPQPQFNPQPAHNPFDEMTDEEIKIIAANPLLQQKTKNIFKAQAAKRLVLAK